MALKVQKVSETSLSAELGETLWYTVDRSEVVPDGDPRAAFLLGTAGKRVPLEEAERLGLVKKGAKAKEAVPEETKEAAPEETKDDVEGMKVAELDAAYGELEGYPADGKKADKVAFAKGHAPA